MSVHLGITLLNELSNHMFSTIRKSTTKNTQQWLFCTNILCTNQFGFRKKKKSGNSHGVAACDFATVSGCDQLVVGPTHERGGILDVLMTDVPDLVRVAVVAPTVVFALWWLTRSTAL